MTTSGETHSAPNHSSATMSSGAIRFPLGPNFETWDVDTQGNASAASLRNAADLDIPPFAPFPRVDRLGRIADWTSPMGETGSYGGGSSAGGSSSHGRRSSLGGSGAGHYNSHRTSEEGDWSFTTVEQRGASNASGGGRRFAGARAVAAAAIPSSSGGRQRGSGRVGSFGQRREHHGHYSHRGYGRFGDRQMLQRKREPSIAVSSSWRIMEEIEFSRLAKLQLDPEDPQVVANHGVAFVYDPSADKITTKSERFLPTDEILQNSGVALTSSKMLEDDAKLMALAKEHGASIVATEAAAATLMASSRSVLPWDLLITCRRTPAGARFIIIDKRPESRVGSVTVNENAAVGAFGSPETVDEVLAQASAEATRLRNNLPQILQKGRVDLEDGRESSLGSVRGAYRYTKLDLTSVEITGGESELSSNAAGGKGENVMIVRSQVRSCTPSQVPLPIVPLLEMQGISTGMDWRSKLDTQPGAVLAHEIRNNGAQLARSVYEALLASAGHLKLAFVQKAITAGASQTRASLASASSAKFSILGMQEYEPYELAAQMNLNIPNGFGILRATVDLIRKQAEETFAGESSGDSIDYLLMRDPNKALLRLYKMNVDEVDAAIAELVAPTTDLHLSDGSVDGEDTITEQDEETEDKDMEQ